MLNSWDMLTSSACKPACFCHFLQIWSCPCKRDTCHNQETGKPAGRKEDMYWFCLLTKEKWKKLYITLTKYWYRAPLQSSRVSLWANYLTDTTALSFGSIFFIILLYLVREEGIKDPVDQLGGSRLGRPLAVLLYLCWVTNGLSSGSSPVRIKFVFRREEHLEYMSSDGLMKPLALNTTQHQAMQHMKQANKNQTDRMYNAEFPLDATGQQMFCKQSVLQRKRVGKKIK